MPWAIVLQDHPDEEGILLLSDDKGEALSIAREVCNRGRQRVVVRPCQSRPPTVRLLGTKVSLSPDH
jgi:hypothetical protein